MVREYVDARGRAGLATDVRSRAVLGKYAKQLILAGGWDRDTLLQAARQFAASKRHPRFFHEWVATIFNATSEREHKQLNDRLPADVLAAIGNPLRRK